MNIKNEIETVIWEYVFETLDWVSLEINPAYHLHVDHYSYYQNMVTIHVEVTHSRYNYVGLTFRLEIVSGCLEFELFGTPILYKRGSGEVFLALKEGNILYSKYPLDEELE